MDEKLLMSSTKALELSKFADRVARSCADIVNIALFRERDRVRIRRDGPRAVAEMRPFVRKLVIRERETWCTDRSGTRAIDQRLPGGGARRVIANIFVLDLRDALQDDGVRR